VVPGRLQELIQEEWFLDVCTLVPGRLHNSGSWTYNCTLVPGRVHTRPVPGRLLHSSSWTFICNLVPGRLFAL
jgi:hypothetical protein